MVRERLGTHAVDDGFELFHRGDARFNTLRVLPRLVETSRRRLSDDAVLHRESEELFEETGVAIVGRIAQTTLLLHHKPRVELRRTDVAHLDVQTMRPPTGERVDDGAIGHQSVAIHAAADRLKRLNELTERGLLNLVVYLVEIRHPLLETALGNLPVGGAQAVFLVLPANLLHRVIVARLRMTIEAGHIGDLHVVMLRLGLAGFGGHRATSRAGVGQNLCREHCGRKSANQGQPANFLVSQDIPMQ